MLDSLMALLFRNAMFDLKYMPVDIPVPIYLTTSLCPCEHGEDTFHESLKEPGSQEMTKTVLATRIGT